MNNFQVYKKIFIIGLLSTNPIVSMSQKNPELVEIQKIDPTIKIDMVYATKNNFTGQVIYTAAKCMLRKEVAQALAKVQQELAAKKLGLKVWDGYRPISAQQKFWDLLAEKYLDEKERENYVVNPKQGGRHTRGTAVDCVLTDLETGQELEKPTNFDHFGPEAWRNYDGPKLTAKAKEHRELLEKVMANHGFKGVQCEWWHFDYNGWENCKPFDIEF